MSLLLRVLPPRRVLPPTARAPPPQAQAAAAAYAARRELARLVALPQPRRCYDQQAATAELGPRAGRRVGGDAHRGGRRVLLQHHDR